MITEEALPTYMAMLNTLDGVRDETGASQTPWAKWTREWTAEENRHGDVMNKYMYLTGRWGLCLRGRLIDWIAYGLEWPSTPDMLKHFQAPDTMHMVGMPAAGMLWQYV